MLTQIESQTRFLQRRAVAFETVVGENGPNVALEVNLVLRPTRAGASGNDQESERLLRGFLTPKLFEAGLICRADDRGDPVIQLAPPLICGEEQFAEIEQVLHSVLSDAWAQF